MTAPAATDATVDAACADLLTAIAEALEVPYPASYDDIERRHRLLSARSAYVSGAVLSVMDGAPPEIAARVLGQSVADSQPGYEPSKREAP